MCPDENLISQKLFKNFPARKIESQQDRNSRVSLNVAKIQRCKDDQKANSLRVVDTDKPSPQFKKRKNQEKMFVI